MINASMDSDYSSSLFNINQINNNMIFLNFIELKTILHSKRANFDYVERCDVYLAKKLTTTLNHIDYNILKIAYILFVIIRI